jgi:hypothetical protein
MSFKEKSNPLTVAIIGAGCSGLTALKNMLEEQVGEVICYEQNDQIGGNWLFSEKASHSSVCETTHIISSKTLSSFEDFPMPENYPDYPSHQQVWRYFHDYATHFKLLPHIRFNTRVIDARPLVDGNWELSLASGETKMVDYLIIANGHHSKPRIPEELSAFSGELLHSHFYKSSKPFTEKKVLVVGAGNSGCDCAVEISRVAAFTAISIRSPQYIIPKFFLGKPTDTFNKQMTWLPSFIANPLRRLALFIQVGSYKHYGLPEPDFAVTKVHPTLNSELLYKIRHGKVFPRTGILKIENREVFFKDGHHESFDTIIAATGYKINFPFFNRNLINWEEANRVPLYLRMFHPDFHRLIFIGLFQPQGAVWPLSDYQARLAAKYILGKWKPKGAIRQLAENDANEISKEFLAAKRHTIEVHYHSFLQQLKKELNKSKKESA